MSEVDRLSTSGTYPALPMAQKRRSGQESRGQGSGERPDAEGRPPGEQDAATASAGQPRAKNSRIDEYA